MESLKDFVTHRLGSAEGQDVIKKLEENKIDPFVVTLMTDDDLKVYFPSYGDRLAIVDFCKRTIKDNQSKDRKSRVLKSLRKKLGIRRMKESSDEEDIDNDRGDMERYGNKNGKRALRVIELGWMTLDDRTRTFKQVRQKRGGGTRKLKVEKEKKRDDLLKIAKDLFFPGGVSSIGSLSDFSCDLQDYKGTSMSSTETVEDMYANTKLNMLRFYLLTTPCEPEEIPDDPLEETESTQSNAEVLPKLHFTKSKRSNNPSAEASINQTSVGNSDVLGNQRINDNGMSSNALPVDVSNNKDTDQNDEVQIYPIANILNSYNIGFGVSADQHAFPTQEFDLYDYVLPSPDDTVQFRLPQPMAASTPLFQPRSQEKVQLVIRRGYAFEDLMEAFIKDEELGKNDTLLNIQRILPNGEVEQADDFGGVLRDLLTEFWEAFYTRCTLGTLCKIPFLRHDFSEKQWDSIVRILKAGYEQCKYFPVALAPSFIHRVITQKHVNEDQLLNDFINFVGESERTVLTKALENMTEVECDDLTDIFEEHKARRLPTKENLKQTLIEIAQKELIQEPMFVIDIWHPYLKQFSPSFIDDLVKEYTPNSRKVISLLNFPDETTSTQQEVVRYLKKFLKELDSKLLARFLRFITGADVVCTQEIKIAFNSETGFSSRPIAHTCSNLLELPTDYSSYPDFRAQFLDILNSNVWVMDIV